MPAEVYQTICRVLDAKGVSYQKNMEKLYVSFGVKGKTLSIKFSIFVNVEKKLVVLLSHLPFEVPEEKGFEMAYAITKINSQLVEGNFEFLIEKGSLLFCTENSFSDVILGDEVIRHMITLTYNIVTLYHDKLYAFSNGELSFKQLMDEI